MKDYLALGPVPAGEDCAQVGTEEYYSKGRQECRTYKKQLLRMFPDCPEGARIAIKPFPHDFGTYHFVCKWGSFV